MNISNNKIITIIKYSFLFQVYFTVHLYILLIF